MKQEQALSHQEGPFVALLGASANQIGATLCLLFVRLITVSMTFLFMLQLRRGEDTHKDGSFTAFSK